MGEIVFWTIIRAAIIIPLLWIVTGYLDFGYWWIVSIMSIYVVVIHPSIIQYRLFEEENRQILTGTLCSTCKHFDKTAVLCMKHDEHPSLHYIPCDSVDWQPGEADYEEQKQRRF